LTIVEGALVMRGMKERNTFGGSPKVGDGLEPAIFV